MTRSIAVGLDVGTTKVCTVVAEAGEDGSLSVLGIGISPCDGLERGRVTNLEATTNAVAESVRAAEAMAGIKIQSVLAGIAGEHVQSFPSSGVVGVSRKDREITREDVRRVLEAARTVKVPGDREMIHCLPRDFAVDDQRGIRDPLGMSAVRLESTVQIVTVQSTAVQDLLRAVGRAGLAVEALVLEPIAAGRAVVGQDEMDLGVALLDIGGGTTDLAVYESGSVTHTAVLGWGGKAVTNDLAVGLRTPFEQAEQIKLRSGVAMARFAPGDEIIEVPGVGGRESRTVSSQVLASIIEPRLEEILSLGLQEMERALNPALLAAGVVLTGGTSAMPAIAQLAERVLGLPARVGVPIGLSGVTDLAQGPRMSAAVGLVRFAIDEGRTRKTGNRLLDRVRQPFRNWFREAF